MTKTIAGKKLEQWLQAKPLLRQLMHKEEVFWCNPSLDSIDRILPNLDINVKDVEEANDRLKRFAPYISMAFPETVEQNGIIESALQFIPNMKRILSEHYNVMLPGTLLLKCDHSLPISGSIKARGGIYEVLKHAETLALREGLLTQRDDYSCFSDTQFTELFNRHEIAVGSTGNLGLAIGIIGSCLGFNVTVHMSAAGQKWKKTLLRSKGVNVIEYDGDYSEAVARGREQSEIEPLCHFVDDENSKDLFMGYAVAALRLKVQLREMDIAVDSDHQLFVYLPCGVGGAPGGITFGLKLIFGANVHCFFAEPTHAPAMLLGIYTEKHDAVCVQDFGIDITTAADGLAVGRPSGFVGKRLKNIIDGFYTISDATLFRLIPLLADCENVFLEPSAMAGFPGITLVTKHTEYIKHNGLEDKMNKAIHIVWATGGSMVPESTMDSYYLKGKEFLKDLKTSNKRNM